MDNLYLRGLKEGHLRFLDLKNVEITENIDARVHFNFLRQFNYNSIPAIFLRCKV